MTGFATNTLPTPQSQSPPQPHRRGLRQSATQLARKLSLPGLTRRRSVPEPGGAAPVDSLTRCSSSSASSFASVDAREVLPRTMSLHCNPSSTPWPSSPQTRRVAPVAPVPCPPPSGETPEALLAALSVDRLLEARALCSGKVAELKAQLAAEETPDADPPRPEQPTARVEGHAELRRWQQRLRVADVELARRGLTPATATPTPTAIPSTR